MKRRVVHALTGAKPSYTSWVQMHHPKFLFSSYSTHILALYAPPKTQCIAPPPQPSAQPAALIEEGQQGLNVFAA